MVSFSPRCLPPYFSAIGRFSRQLLLTVMICVILPNCAEADDSALGVTLGTSLSTAVSSAFQEEPEVEENPIDVELGSLELTSLNGRELESSQLSEKKVVLYFWSIYCRSCVNTLAELEAQKAAFEQENIELLSLHLFESRSEVVAEFLQKLGLTLETFLVPKTIRDLFSVKVLPTSIVFDQDGKMLARFDGMADSEGLRLSIMQRVHKNVDDPLEP
ncbi:MAG: TlpA family protein disulfide reductase [Bdellovibrionales bacterium]|nr:TlpA family protein disulfide reductase [Bdellovibrionales bacterium]